MYSHTINSHARKSRREHLHRRRRILRWHGPRYVRGRRSTRLTTVWALRPRRLSDGVVP
jgi:hypothetical protein